MSILKVFGEAEKLESQMVANTIFSSQSQISLDVETTHFEFEATLNVAKDIVFQCWNCYRMSLVASARVCVMCKQKCHGTERGSGRTFLVAVMGSIST
jgi:hypothetical protein